MRLHEGQSGPDPRQSPRDPQLHRMSTNLGKQARPFLLTLTRVTQAIRFALRFERSACTLLTSITIRGPWAVLIFQAFYAEIVREPGDLGEGGSETRRERVNVSLRLIPPRPVTRGRLVCSSEYQ